MEEKNWWIFIAVFLTMFLGDGNYFCVVDCCYSWCKRKCGGSDFFFIHKLTPPVPGSMLPFSKCQLFPLSQYPMGQKYKVPDRVFCNLSVNRLVCQGLKLKF